MKQYDLESVLGFAEKLKQNNNREWFNSHRKEYMFARARFEVFVDDLIQELSKSEPLEGITSKDCIFRLNRDLRFTKDKTPYKPYFSAYIAPGGRKSHQMGIYVHLEPGNVMLAGGLYEPGPNQLAAWRESIDRDPLPFKEIIENENFRSYFGIVTGERLKTVPRGYPKDHPDANLLNLKSVTVTRRLADSQVVSNEIFSETVKTYQIMKPFLDYLGKLG